MRRALIVQGSPTTTGGLVVGGSAVDMTDHGKPFALHEDEATCGQCKGVYKIFGTATRRRYRGQPGVIEGDLVLCPCGQNRVMASENASCFYHTDAPVGGPLYVAGSSSAVQLFDQQVVLRSSSTGEPLAGVRYRARTAAGQIFEGTTDSMGQTERFRTDTPQRLAFEIAGA